MPKKIKFESFKYCFLFAARELDFFDRRDGVSWDDFLLTLGFEYKGGSVAISWVGSVSGSMEFSLSEPKFYFRGDREGYVKNQSDLGLLEKEDSIKLSNSSHFKKLAMRVAEAGGFTTSGATNDRQGRIAAERQFHDSWADSVDVNNMDVRRSNEACTAPEMRYITKRLGDLKGKKLLDVGCGLGEASVYFALLGADVTSSDLSPGMLDATCRLANANGVVVTPHVAAAENLQLPSEAKFDIIYAGNLLHHVDINATLVRILPHLKPSGLLVTWDPIAYNPAINVYRKKAMNVRTEDEHPLTLKDIRLFRKYFGQVETRYFWLTTLVIFVVMAIGQRRDPNKERYWKSVIDESEKWAWVYKPLELFDSILLTLFPPLRPLCWNVVIIAKPK